MSISEMASKLRQADLIDALADQLETQWQSGEVPILQDFLTGVPGEMRPALLYELAKVDVEYRLRKNPKLRFRNYLEVFPELRELGSSHMQAIRQRIRALATSSWTSVRNSANGTVLGSVVATSEAASSRADIPAHQIADSGTSVQKTDAGNPESGKRVLGRYQLIEQIGSGSFGKVYRAHDTQLTREVAVKIPRSEQFMTDSDAERFINEARILAGMNHPGVVAVHDVGQADGVPFIVADLVRGKTLDLFLQPARPDFRKTAEIVRELAETLHYAHRRGMIHRDIKPSNIMIDSSGRPRLMDFGLAHSSQSATLTLDGQILGTPAYMSPEQASGNSHRVDARSDIYSLGAVLYEMLTAQKPFLGDVQMLIHQALNDDPRLPRRLDDRIPCDLETICLQAMHKLPGRRYQSAELMADDLKRFLDCQPILARPVSRLERLDKWRRRNPWLAASILALAFVMLIVTVGGIWFSVFMARSANEQHRLRVNEQLARELANEELSRSLASNGILRLNRLDAGGLLNLVESIRQCPDRPELRASRIRLANTWIDQVDGQLAGLIGQTSPLGKVCFSPDQKLILTVTDDMGFRVWDATSFAPVTGEMSHATRPQHGNAWFSEDCRHVVTVGKLGQIRVWSIETGELVASVSFSSDELDQAPAMVAHCGNGQLVAIAVAQAQSNTTSVRFLTIPGLEQKNVIEIPGSVAQMEFGPDNSGLAVIDRHSTISRIDQNDGQVVWSVPTRNALPFVIEFSAASHRLATASLEDVQDSGNEDLVFVRDWSTGELATEPMQHDEDVKALRFSPDGKYLATASFDSRVRLWELETGKLKFPPIVQEGPVLAIDFSPDGSLLATGGFATDVTLWNTRNGQQYPAMMHHFGAISSLEFNREGDRLISGSRDFSARIWNVESEAGQVEVLGHIDRVWSVDFSADGKLLAAIAENGSVRLWDTDDFSRDPRKFELGIGSSIGTRFSPQAKDLLVVSQRKAGFWKYDSPSGDFVEFPYSENYRTIEYGPDGKWMVCASDFPFVEVVRLNGDRTTRTRLPHPGPVKCVAIDPAGIFFASACDDGMARIWNATTLALMLEFAVSQSPVEAVAFSPDGRLLATASPDLAIRFWNVTTGEPWGKVIRLKSFPQSVSFHPSGTLLAASLANGEIGLWDIHSGLPCGIPMRHDTFAPCVRFSGDGQWMASGSFDHTVFCRRLPDWIRGTDLESTEIRVQKLIGAKVGKSGAEEALSWEQWQAIELPPRRSPGK